MALSTNRTLITQTGINTHQVLNVGGLDSAGIAAVSDGSDGATITVAGGVTNADVVALAIALG